MANRNPSTCGRIPQDYLGELSAVFSSLDDSALLVRLQEYRPTGRQGYPLKALWRAYVGSFVLNMAHTNALIRRLEDNPEFRALCGFAGPLPHRTTFNRFIQRLSHHAGLVEAAFADLTHQLKALIPGLGRQVAVDATTVRSHCNPNRKRLSDPAGVLDGQEQPQGQGRGQGMAFRVQGPYGRRRQLRCAPGPPCHDGQTERLAGAAGGDSPGGGPVPMVQALRRDCRPWLRLEGEPRAPAWEGRHPGHSYPAHQAHDGLHEGIYTKQGVPTCLGNIPMEYVRSDPEKGHLYRCKGCHLAGTMRGAIRHCDTEVWEDPAENIRLFGVVRRDSQEWKTLYAKRQAIERVFKSMKESRRLERHCIRGLRQITLHAIMSALAFQATVLVRLRAGEAGLMRWMVRKVA